MFDLFMNYANQYKIRQAGIHRYRFRTQDEISCFELYKVIFNTLIQIPHNGSFFDYDKRFLESVFLIQTVDYVYYCNIFFNEAQPNRIIMFEDFLRSHAIEFEVYIENQSNTKKYRMSWNVDHLGMYIEEDDLPFYSYWHWLTDITSSKINKYIILQLPLDVDEYGKTSIYFKSQDVINLINSDNFYYLYFDHCGIPEDESAFIKNLKEGKKLTLEEQLENYTQVLKPIEYDYFEEYMTYKPHAESEMPIDYVGIIDATLRQDLQILYININLKNVCITKLYDLFNVEFQQLIEGVIMFKPKKQEEHTIFFMLNSNKNYNKLQELLTDLTELNSNMKLRSIEYFKHNDFDKDRVYIEINSLVVGLYTRNAEYWATFYSILNEELYFTEWMSSARSQIAPNSSFRSVEDSNFVDKFCGLVEFIQHEK